MFSSYFYCQDVVYIGEIISAPMLTFHLPCLTLCAFYGKVQGLDTIPVVYVVESVHEVVTLLELGRGQEEVELERTVLTDVAYT